MPVRIGELLLKEKRITPDQLQQALNHQKANGGKLGYNLVKMGFVKDEEITALLSKQYGVPSINLTQFEIDPGGHQAHSRGYGDEIPDRAAEPRRRDAHDCDDGSDQRLRDGRHQVHDRLQRGAGRRLGDGGPRGDQKYYPAAAKAVRGGVGAGGGRGTERPRDGEPGASKSCRRRSRASPATSRSSRSCRRSAPRRWRSRARMRRSSGSSTSC